MIETFKGATEAAIAAIVEEQKIRKTTELFLLFSMGSQFDHLIKQQLARLEVFCLVADPRTVTAADVKAIAPKGIILSGGPASVHDEPPPFDGSIFELGIPVLGICLGFQMWARHIGARVTPSTHREFGVHNLIVYNEKSLRHALFDGLDKNLKVLESHGDRIEESLMITVTASTPNAVVAAGQCGHLHGVQFHPEVTETEYGVKMFVNFCFGICGARDRYPADMIAEEKLDALRCQITGKRVLLALSGGTDSSVVAYLLRRASINLVRRLRAVYIKGIDRPDDEEYVLKYFGDQPWLDLVVVDATDRFLAVLKGKSSMKDKRIAMRSVYKEVLEEEAVKYEAHFIAQGTLYTDISESGGGYDSGARKAVIKLHHNTGLGFSIPELTPLDDCVKDGVRSIGRFIGVPKPLLARHPFPGPGLVVRIEGEIDADKLRIARHADEIYIKELREWKLYENVWQAGAVITQSSTTCTKGDDAGSGLVVALWAVWSVNGFTAQPAELPWDFLKHVSQRITNEIREVGSVTYRISGKPPATIEWG